MISILYEDSDLLIVEKPAEISTQPLARHPPSDSLAELIVVHYPELKMVGGSDWGAVHRLDRETSGLVVFARNEETYQKLREDFSKNKIKKEYRALVEGKIEKSGKISWPIGSDPKSSKKVKIYKNRREAIRHKAQEAITTYEPLNSGTPTLLRIFIKTGRRHQIRVHLAAIGHPILGDKVYGGLSADRLYLHASDLSLQHPRTGKTLDLHSAADDFYQSC